MALGGLYMADSRRILPAEAAQLVQAAAQGDQQAWARLVDGFMPLLWSTMRRYRLNEYDAADVVQTTWLRLVQHLSRLDDEARVAAWLVTTASREALRVSQQSKRAVVTSSLAILDAADVDSPAPDRMVTDLARDETVRKLLSRLSVRDQEFLRLLMSDPPMSYAKISQRLGIPIGSIGPTRARALSRLAALAEKDGVELKELTG
jgi:RNA polymerase sigma factor (sigma-70 family)